MPSDAALKSVADVLDERFGLAALWLFGSEAEGRARADSDVDLAALFARRPSPEELLDVRSRVAELLGRDVDLVDLGSASPVIAMQVLRHGQLVADRDPSSRYRFTALLPGRYEDLKIVRGPIEKCLIERIHGRA